jgi:hypothetical protein
LILVWFGVSMQKKNQFQKPEEIKKFHLLCEKHTTDRNSIWYFEPSFTKMGKWIKKNKQYVDYVNKSILQKTFGEARSKKMASIEKEYRLKEIKLNKKRRNVSNIDDIFVSRKNESNQRRWCQIKDTYIEHETAKWEKQRIQLEIETSSTSALVYLYKITHPTTIVFYNNCDTCNNCHEPFVFDHIQYNNICPQCHRVVRVLIASEDQSTDILMFKAQTELNMSSTKSREKITKTDRIPLYRRYLHQFSKDLPEIPKEVFATIYLNLSSIHILSSARSKHAPISSILRNNGMTQYIHQSVRISKLFNGEKIPEIDVLLFDKLIKRFGIICRACGNEYKLLTFEMISHILLKMENEEDLASCFSLPSSHDVLHKSYNRLLHIIGLCEKIDPTLSWKINPLV